jgi:hypothetical protein
MLTLHRDDFLLRRPRYINMKIYGGYYWHFDWTFRSSGNYLVTPLCYVKLTARNTTQWVLFACGNEVALHH